MFVNIANTTLLRRDSYLFYLKAGVKADTLNALRSAPLELDTLFPDAVIKQAEEDIANCIPDAKRGYYGFIIVVVRVRALVRVRRDFLLATYSPHFFPDFFHIWQVA